MEGSRTFTGKEEPRLPASFCIEGTIKAVVKLGYRLIAPTPRFFLFFFLPLSLKENGREREGEMKARVSLR